MSKPNIVDVLVPKNDGHIGAKKVGILVPKKWAYWCPKSGHIGAKKVGILVPKKGIFGAKKVGILVPKLVVISVPDPM